MSVDDTDLSEIDDSAAAIAKKGAREAQIGNKRVAYFSPKEIAEGRAAIAAQADTELFVNCELI